MKSKRKTMLVAAFVVAVVALAGVGYATAGYTATTVNNGNTASSSYTTATSNHSGTFSQTGIAFDTYTDSQNTTPLYLLHGSTSTPIATISSTAYYGIQLGSSLSITLNDVGTQYSSYDMTPVIVGGTINGVNAANGWTYLLKVEGSVASGVAPVQYMVYNYGASNAAWSDSVSDLASTGTVTISLYLVSDKIFQNISTTDVFVAANTATALTAYNTEATASVAPINSAGEIYKDLVIAFTFEGNTAATS